MIQGSVSVAGEPLGARLGRIESGHADAERNDRCLNIESPRDSARLRLGVVECGVREDDAELVAAEAARNVAAAHVAAERGTHSCQRLVADRVAEVVVDRFEVIDIGDEKTQRAVVPHGAIDLDGEPIVEGAAVETAGEPVGVCECRQLLGEERFTALELDAVYGGSHRQAAHSADDRRDHEQRVARNHVVAVGRADHHELRKRRGAARRHCGRAKRERA